MKKTLQIITLLFGEAAEILPGLSEKFDMIFLDAAKGQYPFFFPECLRLLKSGGVLICDDVLYKGMIANDKYVIRRKITIVKRLRAFLKEVMAREDLSSSILPIGDGILLCVKK